MNLMKFQIEDPDSDYEAYDYDYDAYSYDEPIDVCDESNTIYDMNNGDTCKNENFANLPSIDQIYHLSNNSNYKACCKHHEYLHIDECTVRWSKIIIFSYIHRLSNSYNAAFLV